MKLVGHTVTGMILGIVFGVVVGFGLLTQFKESERNSIMPFMLVGMAIVFGVVGMKMGYKMQKETDLNESLGLDKVEDNMYKQGQYWVAASKWKNPSTGKQYHLGTTRSNMKVIVTALNESIIINHQVQGANQGNIRKLHQQAKLEVFKQLREHGEWKSAAIGTAEVT